jgi:hypothetical protein
MIIVELKNKAKPVISASVLVNPNRELIEKPTIVIVRSVEAATANTGLPSFFSSATFMPRPMINSNRAIPILENTWNNSSECIRPKNDGPAKSPARI